MRSGETASESESGSFPSPPTQHCLVTMLAADVSATPRCHSILKEKDGGFALRCY